MKCSVYIAASVDGFIARPDGDIEWLHHPDYAEAKLNGLSYDDFISTVDGIVMGRYTFEKALSFGFWPYEGKPVIVLSSRGVAIPGELEGKVSLCSGSPDEIVEKLGTQGFNHLYIDGGITIQRFLNTGLINELTITRIPILLGRGIPLFHHGEKEQTLRLISADVSENGFVQERYEVLRRI
ncbi:MAG TPA: dihydrofolate reductase family protein [Noviherbaspirillum sp.]|uniref:dihydrofolate reductase family protein n=1 Tax=Noviherbaspirillum sp. TaxID=1926288 RepID=UPI002D6D9175|nr:dihydrofolate reductase family protein [Noviherbaspirillum sp.]HYD96560.1 dihydrofolate reductase family protein [Noviherbaspirillum sp.]